MTVMTAAMVQKYCAMEEMNGRINPAMSDSDEDSNGRPAGSGAGGGSIKGGSIGKQGRSTSISGSAGGHMGRPGNAGRNASISGPPPSASKQGGIQHQPDSEDENDRRTPIKNVKQYQTKL